MKKREGAREETKEKENETGYDGGVDVAVGG
jgi:hypothetical protein